MWSCQKMEEKRILQRLEFTDRRGSEKEKAPQEKKVFQEIRNGGGKKTKKKKMALEGAGGGWEEKLKRKERNY